MSFDKPTRNKLASLVGDCRRLLTEDIRHQLQAVYGLQPEGTSLPISSLSYLDETGRKVASALRLWQEHLSSTEVGTEHQKRTAAFDRLAHETAFTVLNRLAALRMCEEREHVIECVRRGLESDGFALYERFSDGALGGRGQTYRIFLERMFAELSVDLGTLFDLDAPQSLIFPRERCLEEVLSLLNRADLAHVWANDETIGWIYQYFNSKEEREAMREASAAPRNSRELAVRNQFFTPRYVVEFLVDNTLGCIWYEMRRAETALKDACRYLVRRPTEVFLNGGQQPPSSVDSQESLSQDELLKQPIYVPHRAKREPRTIKILDPAVGSGHFLLYAFDLLEVIYQEAWEDDGQQIFEATGKTLREEYADLKALKTAIPELILRHNLHGIDIDLRACQIAALALWLRAQRTYQNLGLVVRPKINRSNIVCAEPMPGEQELLDQFSAQLQPKVIGQLVQAVFEKMKLAGEAGSLLKIEEEIAGAVTDARQKWLAAPKPQQGFLFAGLARPEQQTVEFDFSGITDEAFWGRTEERIYAALQSYAEQAENGRGYQRRLFADDAARGFGFIDLCRKRYDVVLMNPPFGAVSLPARDLLYRSLPESSRDIFAAFVSLFARRLALFGRLGVLTNRLAFFNEFLDKWRENVFMGKEASLDVVADLGYGVLDAVVEAAAYVCSKSRPGRALFLSALKEINKEARILRFVNELSNDVRDEEIRDRDVRAFALLPGNRFAYRPSYKWLHLLNAKGEHNLFLGKGGICSGDDFRFYRCFWEVPRGAEGNLSWRWLAKGGEFSRYRPNTHLLIDWANERLLLRTKNSDRYGEPGVTYTYRTTSNLSGRVLNEGVCFSQGGPGIIAKRKSHLEFVLAYMNSYVSTYCLENMVGGGDFSVKVVAARNLEPRYLEHLPRVELSADLLDWFRTQVRLLLKTIAVTDDDEAHPLFCVHGFLGKESLRSGKISQNQAVFKALSTSYELVTTLEHRITQLLGLEASDVLQAYSETGWPFPQGEDPNAVPMNELRRLEAIPRDERRLKFSLENLEFRFQNKLSHYLHADVEHLSREFRVSPSVVCSVSAQLQECTTAGLRRFTQNALSYSVGCAFGRWDIRFAIGEKIPPELTDPFGPLPTSLPGQLQNEQGAPLTGDDLSYLQAAGLWSYPLEFRADGVLVDDPDHANDIIRRLREVLTVIWKKRAETIEQEACDVLEVADLRDYFQKPSLFFADHLKRYSKSRREAPIYWPISTPSGSYTLWIYYHRLNDDSLYTALNKYVKPKIDETERQLRRIESELPNATGREASSLRIAFEETGAFLDELRGLRDEIARVADLPYKPNLNDGVLITAAPLWRLFRFPKWRKELQECWKELEGGRYDWAHLAYSIWPNRVRDVCKIDRSIAIAHGLESLCEIAAKPAKKRRSKKIAVEETVPGDEE